MVAGEISKYCCCKHCGIKFQQGMGERERERERERGHARGYSALGGGGGVGILHVTNWMLPLYFFSRFSGGEVCMLVSVRSGLVPQCVCLCCLAGLG